MPVFKTENNQIGEGQLYKSRACNFTKSPNDICKTFNLRIGWTLLTFSSWQKHSINLFSFEIDENILFSGSESYNSSFCWNYNLISEQVSIYNVDNKEFFKVYLWN